MGGADYNLCPKCKTGRLKLEASYKNCNGQLVNVKDLAQRKADNKTILKKRRQPDIIVQATPATIAPAAQLNMQKAK